MYSVEAHTNTDTIAIPISDLPVMTQLNSSAADGQQLRIDSYNSLLRTLLILDIVILDKLHRRSNLSLLLIHLRCTLDSFIDRQNAGDEPVDALLLVQVMREFNKSMSLVFENSKFFNLTELQSIYTDLLKELKIDTDVPEADTDAAQLCTIPLNSIDFDLFANKILCCSESLADYKHFNRTFDESTVMDYELDKIRSHYISTSFNYKKNQKQNQKATSAPCICKENILLVQSPEFMEFHLKRWKTLNLLDRHIFK